MGAGCWKWLNKILKEAGVDVTDANKEWFDGIIHEYIGGPIHVWSLFSELETCANGNPR